jgi:GDP-4-dehydro-6-deoxy-D-mannose reductase
LTPRTAAITGGGGFVGQWLAKALLRRGDTVWLSGLGAIPDKPAILSSDEWHEIRWMHTDITSDDDVQALINAASADIVVHLAGISFVPEAEKTPDVTHNVNVLGAGRLLRAVAANRTRTGIDPTVLVVGSGTQYGTHDAAEMPLTESAEQRPANVYAASKLAQENLALDMASQLGLRVVCTRSFSHSGIGHDERFLLPALVKRARSRDGGCGNISIGNDVIRDYTHIDDVVAAYLALVERGVSGTAYNVASGVGVSVRQIAQAVLERAGGAGEVVTEAGLQRPSDMPILIGAPDHLVADTGWRREKTYLDILDDLMAAH